MRKNEKQKKKIIWMLTFFLFLFLSFFLLFLIKLINYASANFMAFFEFWLKSLILCFNFFKLWNIIIAWNSNIQVNTWNLLIIIIKTKNIWLDINGMYKKMINSSKLLILRQTKKKCVIAVAPWNYLL